MVKEFTDVPKKVRLPACLGCRGAGQGGCRAGWLQGSAWAPQHPPQEPRTPHRRALRRAAPRRKPCMLRLPAAPTALTRGPPALTLLPHPPLRQGVNAVRFGADARSLLVGAADHNLRVFGAAQA